MDFVLLLWTKLAPALEGLRETVDAVRTSPLCVPAAAPPAGPGSQLPSAVSPPAPRPAAPPGSQHDSPGLEDTTEIWNFKFCFIRHFF